MTYWTTHPRALDAAGQPDGRYAVQVAGGKVTGWTVLPADIIASIVSGRNVTVDNTDPTHPVINGAEMAVMDGITNPPELAYNDAGDDYVYMD